MHRSPGTSDHWAKTVPPAELLSLSLVETGKLIRSGQVSSIEVTSAVLDRVQHLNPTLNAYITVLAEDALASAKKLDDLLQAGTYLGRLHGIPVSLKDTIATAGIRTTAASPVLRDWVPDRDATVVRRLRSAGAVILGKANLYEFGYGFPNAEFGVTPNPWNLERITGGTSSGSASGVAAGLCYGSIGTDAGGSIRIPAAFCGVVGFKPTFGLISRAGILPGAYSLDSVGPLTRTVTDAAVVTSALVGRDSADPATVANGATDVESMLDAGVRGLRIGILTLAQADWIDAEIRINIEAAYQRLREEGAVLRELTLPEPTLLRTVMYVIFSAECADAHRELFRVRGSLYGASMRSMLMSTEFLPAPAYVRAQRLRQRIVTDLSEQLANFDALVLPAVPMLAYPISRLAAGAGDGEGETLEAFLSRKTRFTVPFNLTGQPAIVVPSGLSSDGLPIGLQIVGKPFEDAMVLRVARGFERISAWKDERPPITRHRS